MKVVGGMLYIQDDRGRFKKIWSYEKMSLLLEEVEDAVEKGVPLRDAQRRAGKMYADLD